MYRNDSNAAVRFNARTLDRAAREAAPSRYRARDFGVGYGSSSGYGAPRRYASSATPTRFRLV